MSERKNEPAFPVEGNDVIYFGMSIREHFASICLQGLLANPDFTGYDKERKVKFALEYSDMLLEALDK
jgi:hypothetical protein